MVCPGAAIAGALGAGAISWEMVHHHSNFKDEGAAEGTDDSNVLVNWSSTHECRPKEFHQPETTQEVEALVSKAHDAGVIPWCRLLAELPDCIQYEHRNSQRHVWLDQESQRLVW